MKFLKIKNMLVGIFLVGSCIEAGESSTRTFLQAADTALRAVTELRNLSKGASLIPTQTRLLPKEEKAVEPSSLPLMVGEFINAINNSPQDASYAEEVTPAPSYNHMLLYGPPGVGKSVLAKYIADNTHKFFFPLSATKLMGSPPRIDIQEVIGSSFTDYLMSFFVPTASYAKILIIDEIDMIGQDRSQHTNELIKLALLQLLTAIDTIKTLGLPVNIVATTNIEDLEGFFDPALLERFAWKCPVDHPSREDKIKIFKFHLNLNTQKELALLKEATGDKTLDTTLGILVFSGTYNENTNTLLDSNMNLATQENDQNRTLYLKDTFNFLSPRQIQQLIEFAGQKRAARLGRKLTPLHTLTKTNPLSQKIFGSENEFIIMVRLLLVGKCGEKVGKVLGALIVFIETNTLLPKLLERSPQLKTMLEKLKSKHPLLPKLLWILNGALTLWASNKIFAPSLDFNKVETYLKKRKLTPVDFQKALDEMKIKVPAA